MDAPGRVLSEMEGGIGLITFSNPSRLNAMSVAMWRSLDEALERFERDWAVRVVVLTGAGHKAFVSGADISEFEASRGDAGAQLEYDRMTAAGRARLAAFTKPVIARVRGFCLGGGLGIALHADLRIAAVDSAFGMPGARLGTALGADIVRRLVGLVGPAQASAMLFTGATIDSREAARIGLVNRVVPDEELSDVIVELARSIADNAPLSVHAAKVAVQSAVPEADAAHLAAIEKAVAACADSWDYREGRAAFREKRRPRFEGR